MNNIRSATFLLLIINNARKPMSLRLTRGLKDLQKKHNEVSLALSLMEKL